MVIMPIRQRRRVLAPPLAIVILWIIGMAQIGCVGGESQQGFRESDSAGGIHFDREVVCVRVEKDTVEVEGIYQMVCSPTRMRTAVLFYPYPRDSLMGDARTLFVECRGADGFWRPVPFVDQPLIGARWTIPLDLADTLAIRTIYRQALRASSARYIVTSTRSWREPLAKARFEISLPEDALPEYFSYPFVEELEQGRRVFVYEAADFWPEMDVVVTWTTRASKEQ